MKASGADLVYLGGIYDNNGGQLIKDKVAVLGDNDGDVKLMAPDGFTGYPDMLKLPESAGMYLTFAGLTQDELVKAGGAGVKLFEAYKAKYGKDPDGSYPLYGVAAMQVILAAIEKSDGTRKGVTEAVLSGEGITIPADQSVVGKEIKIDPTTGDTTAKDLTIELVKDGKETFFKSQSLSPVIDSAGPGLFRARRFSSTLHPSQSVLSSPVRISKSLAKGHPMATATLAVRWNEVQSQSQAGPDRRAGAGLRDPGAGGHLDRGQRRSPTGTASSGRCWWACRTACCTP